MGKQPKRHVDPSAVPHHPNPSSDHRPTRLLDEPGHHWSWGIWRISSQSQTSLHPNLQLRSPRRDSTAYIPRVYSLLPQKTIKLGTNNHRTCKIHARNRPGTLDDRESQLSTPKITTRMRRAAQWDQSWKKGWDSGKYRSNHCHSPPPAPPTPRAMPSHSSITHRTENRGYRGPPTPKQNQTTGA